MVPASEIRTYSYHPPLLGGAAVPGLDAVLRWMLATDKARRYPDAAAAAEAMEWVARAPGAGLCREMLERRVVPALRALFLRHWLAREGAPWDDTPEGGRRFLERELLLHRKAARWLTRERLEAGDSEAWDATALCTELLWSQVCMYVCVCVCECVSVCVCVCACVCGWVWV